MKGKFQEAIEKSFNAGDLRGIDDKLKDIATVVNTLHQQALKDVLNEILTSSHPVTCYDGLKIRIKAIAKENNIKL